MQERIFSKGIIFNKIYLLHSVLVNQSKNFMNRPHNHLTNNLMANSLIYQTHSAWYTVFTLISV